MEYNDDQDPHFLLSVQIMITDYKYILVNKYISFI
jgi:hypothetical protein